MLAMGTSDEWYNATNKTFDRFVTVPGGIHLNHYGSRPVDLAVGLVYKAMVHQGKGFPPAIRVLFWQVEHQGYFLYGLLVFITMLLFCPWSLCPRACLLTVTLWVQKHGNALNPSSIFSSTEKVHCSVVLLWSRVRNCNSAIHNILKNIIKNKSYFKGLLLCFPTFSNFS